jgi:hypothetical protein
MRATPGAALARRRAVPHPLRDRREDRADFGRARPLVQTLLERALEAPMASRSETKVPHKELDDLLRLRDEIRLQVHLAGMDAKTAWQKLEPRFAELERDLEQEGELLTDATYELARNLKKALKQFRSRI